MATPGEIARGVGVPGRRGYPGRRYTEFSIIYERTVRVEGHNSNTSRVPTFTVLNDNVMRLIIDSTGHITETQILGWCTPYNRQKQLNINVLLPLYQLMMLGIGKGMTRLIYPNPLDSCMKVGDKQVFCAEKARARKNSRKFSAWLARDKQ